MAIYLDDQAVSLTAENLGGALAAAREHLAPTGRIVVEVQLDGQSLTGDELAQQQHDPVDEAELRLYSADPRELAGQALGDVRAKLDAARAIQADAADLLQQDQAAEAMQKFAQAIDVWLQTQQTVQHSANLLAIDLNAVTFEDRPVVALFQDLAEALRSLKQLLNDRDTVGLADALAYEWPELTDRWDRMIGQLIARIEEG